MVEIRHVVWVYYFFLAGHWTLKKDKVQVSSSTVLFYVDWRCRASKGSRNYSFITLSWDAGTRNCSSDNTHDANQSNSSRRSSLHPKLYGGHAGSNIQQVVQGIMSSIEPLKMNFLGGWGPFLKHNGWHNRWEIQGYGVYLGASLASMAASSPMAVWMMTSGEIS